MQYLISVGFPKDAWKRADQLHCSEMVLLKAGHIVKKKKSAQTSLEGAVNHFCFVHLFRSNKSHQILMAPEDKQKQLTLAQWFLKWQNTAVMITFG